MRWTRRIQALQHIRKYLMKPMPSFRQNRSLITSPHRGFSQQPSCGQFVWPHEVPPYGLTARATNSSKCPESFDSRLLVSPRRCVLFTSKNGDQAAQRTSISNADRRRTGHGSILKRMDAHP